MDFPMDMTLFIRDRVGKCTADELFFQTCDTFADKYSSQSIRETLRFEYFIYLTSPRN